MTREPELDTLYVEEAESRRPRPSDDDAPKLEDVLAKLHDSQIAAKTAHKYLKSCKDSCNTDRTIRTGTGINILRVCDANYMEEDLELDADMTPFQLQSA